ncbi:MAG: TIGR03943 family protein [Gordonia sp. (in: high G+C Gram-positive bacteria)]|uniref:TIGR03943 family putative permease subunit n=1 Tax=Gordonia sp. (in: high G+C Gram-positive bacteria) TaxID=84139 RepID=UPI0039E5C09C
MNRETQNLILLCIGLTVGKVTLDGSYERYVRPVMFPWLLISAIVLVLLALVSIVRDMRPGAHVADDDGHHHGGGRSLWMLAVPILVVFFLVPPALKPATDRQSNASATQSLKLDPLPPGPNPKLSVFDVVQRAYQSDGGGLHDTPITLKGTVQHFENHTYLGQIVIICCAADARTFRVEVVGPGAQQMAAAPADSWWELVGVVVDGTATQERHFVPEVTVTEAHPTAAPENPYNY